MSNNKDYYAAAKFYGVTSIILTLACLGIFMMYCKEYSSNNNEDSYWSSKYDSLYDVYSKNKLQWEKFEQESKGYYFVNPTEKKGIKNFDLIKFTEE